MCQKLALLLFLGRRSWVPIYHNVAWTEAYLRAKFRLDPSNRLATVYQRYRTGHRTDRQDRQTDVDRTRYEHITSPSLYTYHESLCLLMPSVFYVGWLFVEWNDVGLVQQTALIKASPKLLFRVHNRRHGHYHTLLMASDYERATWRTAIRDLLGRSRYWFTATWPLFS